MAAALPAIVFAAKAVGTVMAMKTMAEGIQEGDMGKAILGGVGAYFGASSMGAFSSASGAAGSSASKVGSISSASGGASSGAAAGSQQAMLANQTAAFGEAGANLTNQALTSVQGGSGLLGSTTAGAESGAFSGSDNILNQGPMADSLASDSSFADTVTRGASPTDAALSSSGDLAKSGGFSGGSMGSEAANSGGKGLLGSISDTGGDMIGWAEKNPELAGNMIKGGGQILSGYSQGKAAENEREFRQKLLDERRAYEDQKAAERRARLGHTALPTRLKNQGA